MKTLGKLKINLDKMLKNEELVNLRGGYSQTPSCCKCTSYNGASYYVGAALITDCTSTRAGCISGYMPTWVC